MAWEWSALGVVGLVAYLLTLGLALFVYFSAPGRIVNRWLSLTLVAEAHVGQADVLVTLTTDPGHNAGWDLLETLGAVAFVFLFLGFLGVALETPLVKPLRHPAVQRTLAALAFLVCLAVVLVPEADLWLDPISLMHVGILTYSLLAALDHFRRTPRRTLVRQRATAYLVAFGTRDIVVLVILLYQFLVEGDLPRWLGVLFEAGAAVYFVSLVYGILKTQLFEIDVKLRWTFHKGSITAVFAAVFVIVAQLAENMLNQRLGWLWGGVAAGLLVFAIGPITRMTDHLAKRAVPDAKPIAAFTDTERTAFYAEHVRAAWEDGSIDRSDRALLNTLRNRLGLPRDIAARIELDVTSE